jgi:hypothetical protein
MIERITGVMTEGIEETIQGVIERTMTAKTHEIGIGINEKMIPGKIVPVGLVQDWRRSAL